MKNKGSYDGYRKFCKKYGLVESRYTSINLYMTHVSHEHLLEILLIELEKKNNIIDNLIID